MHQSLLDGIVIQRRKVSVILRLPAIPNFIVTQRQKMNDFRSRTRVNVGRERIISFGHGSLHIFRAWRRDPRNPGNIGLGAWYDAAVIAMTSRDHAQMNMKEKYGL